MSQHPSTAGRVYGCTHCDTAGLMTTSEFWKHAKAEHPETITTERATPEQMKAGMDALAGLRKFDTRNR